MQIELDPRGRKVVIFGTQAGARQAVRRFVSAGATVTFAVDGPLPSSAERLGTVRYAGLPAGGDVRALLRLVGPAWLIVDVGLPGDLADRLRELAGHLHVMVVREAPAAAGGQVTLVGGGPGQTGLLTLDACEALRRADVVLFDRLAPTDDLAALAPAAELVDVGKLPYHHRVPQRSIEDLMLARARAGDAVVRLKGGDPFVFGRGAEEVRACLDAGVPVRVIPGVSSAVAVPAGAGIPVTHRGVAKAFTVISGHVPPEPHELEALVLLGGTIVILMGVGNLPQIMAGLCRAGLDPRTPAAVIERGLSDQQRSVLTTVAELPGEMRRREVASPAIVVLGDVVAVSPQFAFSEWAGVPRAGVVGG